jgi:hypothetical protein
MERINKFRSETPRSSHMSKKEAKKIQKRFSKIEKKLKKASKVERVRLGIVRFADVPMKDTLEDVATENGGNS